jgi:hypothetical protein
MPKYTKKPVEIEAEQWTGDNVVEILNFCTQCFSYERNGENILAIATLEGTMTASTFSGSGASLTNIPAGQLTGTVSGDRGVTAGSTTVSFLEYNGTSATAGQLDGGTTAPSGTTRLNYGGYLYATRFYGDGSNLSNVAAASVSGGVYTTGDQTIGGIKTFTNTIGGNITGNANTVNGGVYTTGDQTIGGTKTFSSPIISSYSAGWGTPSITLNGAQPNIRFADAGQYDAIIGTNDNNFYILGDTDSDGNFDTNVFSVSLSGLGMSTAGTFTSAGNIVSGGNGTFDNLKGAGTRNVNSTSTGILTNSTSSARYKQDIVSVDYVYEDILKLQPKTFKLKSEVEESENPITYGGFIAEDVHEIDSLKVFVGYAKTPDGDLIPDSLYYAEMVSALVSAIKHQDSRIKALEAQVQALSE